MRRLIALSSRTSSITGDDERRRLIIGEGRHAIGLVGLVVFVALLAAIGTVAGAWRLHGGTAEAAAPVGVNVTRGDLTVTVGGVGQIVQSGSAWLRRSSHRRLAHEWATVRGRGTCRLDGHPHRSAGSFRGVSFPRATSSRDAPPRRRRPRSYEVGGQGCEPTHPCQASTSIQALKRLRSRVRNRLPV